MVSPVPELQTVGGDGPGLHRQVQEVPKHWEPQSWSYKTTQWAVSLGDAGHVAPAAPGLGRGPSLILHRWYGWSWAGAPQPAASLVPTFCLGTGAVCIVLSRGGLHLGITLRVTQCCVFFVVVALALGGRPATGYSAILNPLSINLVSKLGFLLTKRKNQYNPPK